jgi:hypothetical protein
MDPYLEGALWTTIHFSLSTEIVRQLAPKLRPRYLVLPAERFVMETPESVAVSTADIYPDVGVAETRSVARTAPETTLVAAPLELATVIPTPIPHVTIEIRDTAYRQLVTTIKVLSPTNKRGDGRARNTWPSATASCSVLLICSKLTCSVKDSGCPCKSPYPQRRILFFSVALKDGQSPKSGLSASEHCCLWCPYHSSLATEMSLSICNRYSR